MATTTKEIGRSPKEVREQMEADIRDCIKAHKAELRDGSEVIVFRRPDTVHYSMTFRKQGSHLIVTGDMGDAIYQWSQRPSWGFLGGLNFGYFRSKCQAHRNGYNARGWDEDVARFCLHDVVIQWEKEGDLAERMRERGVETALEDLVVYDRPNLCSREEWLRWLADHGQETLGDAWWEWAPSVGNIPDFHMLAHWVGLTAAIAQLDPENGAESARESTRGSEG